MTALTFARQACIHGLGIWTRRGRTIWTCAFCQDTRAMKIGGAA